MKKINTYIKDRNTLILESDAEKGDYISLSDLSNVDYSRIETLIEQAKDQVYERKLKEYKIKLDLEFNLEKEKIEKKNQNLINELNSKITELLNKTKNELEICEQKNKIDIQNLKHNLEKEYSSEINKLQNQISNFDLEKESLIQKFKTESTLINYQKDNEIFLLKQEISLLKEKFEENLNIEKLKINNSNNEIVNNLKIELAKQKSELDLKYTNEINQINEKHRLAIIEKDKEISLGVEKINQLQRSKSLLNVKQTGENLEAWCDNEIKSYMQNGLLNCEWNKDNEVIKLENEQKGSKADYIFKVYATEEHNPNELLTSVCLDMKDENPDSINKKKNSDYYKQLDNNRNKKNCKYAVLVSNLELDKPNDLPIFRVSEYKDMYVVRPAYMMTFLNMITSLTVRFSNLILKENKEKIEFRNALELLEKFDELKNTYLDKPLLELEKMVSDLASHNEKIIDESRKIKEIVDKISTKYINSINAKLDKFEMNISKAYRKYERNN